MEFAIFSNGGEIAFPAMYARTRVLEDPQLLAAILRHLDPKTLFTAGQRVCRRWNMTTNASEQPPIDPGLSKVNSGTTDLQNIQTTPLLQQKFKPWFKDEPDMASSENGLDPAAWCNALEIFKSLGEQSGIKRLLRNHATWRELQSFRPPLTRLGYLDIKYPKHGGSEPTVIAVMVEFPQGLTMWELYDFTLHLLATTSESDFMMCKPCIRLSKSRNESKEAKLIASGISALAKEGTQRILVVQRREEEVREREHIRLINRLRGRHKSPYGRWWST